MKENLINGCEVGKLLANLHKISKDLNKPFDAPEVLLEYNKRFGGIKEEIAIYIIHPIYYPPEDCSYADGELIILPDFH